MTRRKGEKPVARPLDQWSPAHPVAHAMRTGTPWFGAWMMQKSTPIASLAQVTGIPAPRLMTIDAGDRLSRAEVDALARAWSISATDLIASMPDPSPLAD